MDIQIQALERTALLLPMRPGQAERRAHDYRATAPPPCLPLSIGQLHRRRPSGEFRKFLDTIESSVPPQLHVHLIMDNYGTHKTSSIQR